MSVLPIFVSMLSDASLPVMYRWQHSFRQKKNSRAVDSAVEGHTKNMFVYHPLNG